MGGDWKTLGEDWKKIGKRLEKYLTIASQPHHDLKNSTVKTLEKAVKLGQSEPISGLFPLIFHDFVSYLSQLSTLITCSGQRSSV